MRAKLFVCSIILLSFFLMSHSGGRATAQEKGSTGAPDETGPVCSGCHSAGNFSPQAILTILDADGNEATSWDPGASYDVKLTINTTGTPSAFGFQMVSLSDSDNSAINNWSTTDLPQNVGSAMLSGRQYVEHTSPLGNSEINLKWTAPEAGAGDVKFYYSANAVNGNGNTNGDGAVNDAMVLTEAVVNGVQNLSNNFSIFPNPAEDHINIEGDLNDFKQYEIVNVIGQRIQAGAIAKTIKLQDHKAGIYILKLISDDDQKIVTKKIMLK